MSESGAHHSGSARGPGNDSLAELNGAVMTKQFTQIKSYNRVTVRLRINPGDRSWLTLERPGGRGREIIEIPENKVDDVADRFSAINGDPEKFAAFVNARGEMVSGISGEALHESQAMPDKSS